MVWSDANGTVVHTPADYGLFGEEIELRAADGTLLRCYLLPQRLELPRPKKFQMLPITPAVWKDGETDEEYMARRPTVIMFHGNGGNVGHRIPLGMMFQQFMRCNVLMVSYRGYGNSEGSPSERGFQMDAQAALNFVVQDPRFGKTPLILYGQSIGGAVSIDLASRNPEKITALILENTFTSLPALVPHVLPLLSSFTFLCHQKWESEAKIFGYVPQGSSVSSVSPSSASASGSSSSRTRLQVEREKERQQQQGSAPVGGARGIKDQRYKGIPKGTRVLLLSGKMDQIVPPEHMEALRVAFKERTKTRKELGIPGPFISSSSSSPSSLKSKSKKQPTSGITFSTGRSRSGSRTRTLSAEKDWEVLDDGTGGDEKAEEALRVDAHVDVNSDVDMGVRGEKIEEEAEEEERSRWEEFPSGSHNDTSAQAGYWNAVEEFVSEVSREWVLAKEESARL
ncbi:hypothetical protein D9758_016115 [Tetrapyrgos nigripes]|uniref:AB hydrolase-1 domain-containing protein n=1 Tax=Tetrapyrgos nigripes TaxID=182062 RepID=A0A8H5C1M3_9AGAR|nr:hypothetical protein D9758_016115 [Tetrapyrgos nigripes]